MKPVTVYLDNLDILRDISFAISCVQDYGDTIDTDSADGMKEYDSVILRVDRLLTFYYQLIGFDYKKLHEYDQELGLQ